MPNQDLMELLLSGGGQNPILSTLLSGGQMPTDPRATFMAQNFPYLPGRDSTSNFNTILDLLSPGQSQYLLEQVSGPQRIEQAFGLDPEQVGAYIRQSLGMELSPAAQGAQQTNLMQYLAPLLQAEASGRQASVAEREASVKEKEFERGPSGADQKAQMETTLMSLALGASPSGEPVPDEVKQRAFMVLRGIQSNPGLEKALGEMLSSNNENSVNTALQLIGLPVQYIEPGWFETGGFQPKAAGPAGAPANADDAYQRALGEYRNMIAPLMQGAQ